MNEWVKEMMVIVSMISNEVSFAGYEVSAGVDDGVI